MADNVDQSQVVPGEEEAVEVVYVDAASGLLALDGGD